MCKNCAKQSCNIACPNAPYIDFEICEHCGEEMDGMYVHDRNGHCSECWEDWAKETVCSDDIELFASEKKDDFLINWFYCLENTEIIKKALQSAFETLSPEKQYEMKQEYALNDIEALYEFMTKEAAMSANMAAKD